MVRRARTYKPPKEFPTYGREMQILGVDGDEDSFVAFLGPVVDLRLQRHPKFDPHWKRRCESSIGRLEPSRSHDCPISIHFPTNRAPIQPDLNRG
jgi:hypothetical protein